MTYSDRSTRHTDAGRCQCFLAANEKTLNVVEKVRGILFLFLCVLCWVYYYNTFFLTLTSVIMPPSALDILTRLNINYPMLFKLSNKKSNRQTHCGVLEFIADEEKIYIPYWVLIISYYII